MIRSMKKQVSSTLCGATDFKELFATAMSEMHADVLQGVAGALCTVMAICDVAIVPLE